MGWLVNFGKSTWYTAYCDYCCEKNLCHLIGDLVHMGIGSLECINCEKAREIEREELIEKARNHIPKPTKEQLKWRKKRDDILNKSK